MLVPMAAFGPNTASGPYAAAIIAAVSAAAAVAALLVVLLMLVLIHSFWSHCKCSSEASKTGFGSTRSGFLYL